MKLFVCQVCSQLLYFENTLCERCGSQVGYLPEREQLSAVTPDGPAWIARADPTRRYRFCANWEQSSACNWMLEADGDASYCRACRHNRTIPDISDPGQRALWIRLETAKRRLVYSLIKLDLPLVAPDAAEGQPLVFEFLADGPGRRVMTGHESGTITISLREADDAARESARASLLEPYRTLLGHFRHEIGHYYWDLLVRDGGRLEAFRALFGDERADYGQALQRYYANGPVAGWASSFMSAYASMHPWEDFAETFAHYLHIVDTLEMANAFGVRIAPQVAADTGLAATGETDPYACPSADALVAAWLPIAFAFNSLNRTMGQPDLYPFIISVPAVAKLEFVRALVRRTGERVSSSDARQEPGPRPRTVRAAAWRLLGLSRGR